MSSAEWRYGVSEDGAQNICVGGILDPSYSTVFDRTIVLMNGEALVLGGTVVQAAESIPASAGGVPGATWNLRGVCDINSAGDYYLLGSAGLPGDDALKSTLEELPLFDFST